MLGSELIAELFSRKGIRRVFTFPGGTIGPLFDSLVKRDIELFCSRHEQGAGYAALAAARLTNTPQVVMVTSGPGVTNLVSCIADAWFDSTPLIAITGQVGTGDLTSGRAVRQTGFQQIDTCALMKPIAKAVFLPMSPVELPAIMEKAFTLAAEGRPGPVVIDLPMDVQRGSLEWIFSGDFPKSPPLPEPAVENLGVVAEWLAHASRPVILAGQGVILAKACAEVRQLAAWGQIPVAMSLLGLGIIPTNSPHALGFVGHTGNQYANRAVHEADLLLVVGARLDVRQTGTRTDRFVPDGKVIRIDIDAAELDFPRVKSHLDVYADAKLALRQLLAELTAKARPDLNGWHSTIRGWKRQFALNYSHDDGALKPQMVIETVNRLTAGEDVIVVSGVGSHQQWTARHFDFDLPARAWLTSGGHGTMGYDLPTAIGAQLAFPERTVLCFVGDGSLQMNIQELQTAIQYHTPVKIFVLDNHRLAIVSQFQLLNWKSDPTTGNKINPDFVAIGRAYGFTCFRLDKSEDSEAVIAAALAEPGPVLVHCLIDPNEDVTPMLLAGQTMDAMWPYGQ